MYSLQQKEFSLVLTFRRTQTQTVFVTKREEQGSRRRPEGDINFICLLQQHKEQATFPQKKYGSASSPQCCHTPFSSPCMPSSFIFICLQYVISLLNEDTSSINTPVVFLALFYPATDLPFHVIDTWYSDVPVASSHSPITFFLTPCRVRPCSLTTFYGTHMLIGAVVVLLCMPSVSM